MTRSPDDDDPWLGATLSGCRLVRLLGRGGMGAAYVARRDADGLEVVIKLLVLEGAGDPRLVARLRREGDALRRVRRHPNLVAVLGVAVDGPGPPHLTLELAQGVTLRQAIDQAGRLSPAAATRAARDVARGLATLHGHGILHRDVKPDNVVLGADGRARLIDLGIAKDAFLTALTAPGQLLGTAEYMAPERWAGGPQDARADLFSLGATLYHALTGRPPFVGGSLEELMEEAQAGELTPPRALAPEVSPDLERVVLHLLDPSPRFRYGRAERVADDLERTLRGEPPEGPPCLLTLDGPAAGARHPLLPGLRFVVGASPRAAVRLADAGVAPDHAEVRREEAGFMLHALRGGADTWVGDERITRPRALEDGDIVRVGAARLALRDPDGRRRPPEWLLDLERQELPDAVVSGLARAGDPRALAALLELLEPDPLVERAADEALRRLDAGAAPAVLARRLRLAAEARAATPALLQAAAGEALGADPVAWLSWWVEARGRFTCQVGPARPARTLRLVAPEGDPAALLARAGEPGVLLVGRDERCQLRLEHPTVSRLHATVLRLHRRLVLRDEGGPAGTRLDGQPVQVAFLDPGATLRLGDVSVAVEGADLPAPAAGGLLVDAWAFQALDEAGHPSTVAGHLGALQGAARLEWVDAVTRDLHPQAPALAADLARAVRAAWGARAARARAALAATFGSDLGPDPAVWRAATQGAGLPAQALPCGWTG